MAELAAIPAFLAANAGTIALIGTGLTAASTIASGQAQAANYEAEARNKIAAGQAIRHQREFEAKQLDIKAKQEMAAAQQDARQLERNKKLALSKLQARSASSGFSATDPTSLALADEIERYGTLQRQMANFGGKMRRQELELSAKGKRFTGQSALSSVYSEANAAKQSAKAARTGSYLSAGGTLLSGASDWAVKYGGSFGSGASSRSKLRYGTAG